MAGQLAYGPRVIYDAASSFEQHSAVYLKTRNGIGGPLGLKIWSRFKVNCNRQISKRIIEKSGLHLL